MCEFCNMQYDPSAKLNMDREHHTYVVSSAWTALLRGVDKNGRMFFFAGSDDYTDRYYPKFCPECGKK